MKLLRWTLVHGILAGCLWYGFEESVQGAANVALFLAWTQAVVGILSSTDTAVNAVQAVDGKFKTPSVPRGVDMAFSMAVVLFLVWHSYWWTGAIYLIGSVATSTYWDKLQKRAAREQAA